MFQDQKNYPVSGTLLNLITNYLSTRPYNEVFQGIKLLTMIAESHNKVEKPVVKLEAVKEAPLPEEKQESK